MTVFISLLRGINVGGNNMVKMETLRELYAELKLRDAASYVQSGNVVFRSAAKDSVRLGKQIEDGIERTFGHRPRVVLRTAAELRDVVARNPFAARSGIEPNRLLVTFLNGSLPPRYAPRWRRCALRRKRCTSTDAKSTPTFPMGSRKPNSRSPR